jgi:hypothetical protein
MFYYQFKPRSVAECMLIVINQGYYEEYYLECERETVNEDKIYMYVALRFACDKAWISFSESKNARKDINEFIGNNFTLRSFLIEQKITNKKFIKTDIYSNWNNRYVILEALRGKGD